jgi:hypothetical protein
MFYHIIVKCEWDKDQSNGSFGVHGEIEWASWGGFGKGPKREAANINKCLAYMWNFCDETGCDAVRRGRCIARILFVTGIAGGVGVETVQHRGILRKSNGGSRIVLNLSLMRAATMSPPSEILHNDLLASRLDAIPDKNNLTVPNILEKSWSANAVDFWRLPAGSVNHPDIILRCSHIKGSQESRNHKALSHTGILISSRYWSA